MARRAGAVGPRAGAVTFVQRFGGALNLNVHFHCVIPDGVFVREDDGLRFVELAPPSDDEVMAVLRRVVALGAAAASEACLKGGRRETTRWSYLRTTRRAAIPWETWPLMRYCSAAQRRN